MRLLISGASGFLGQALCAGAEGSAEVLALGHRRPGAVPGGESLDLRDERAVYERVRRWRPSHVLHAAADNRSHSGCWGVNVAGSAALADAARKVGARLVAVSSDVVHDGRGAPYADDARPRPLNLYARSKALAEELVRRLHPGALLVRTSLIYGTDAIDRGTAAFRARLAAGERLRLFGDSVRQPSERHDLARALLALVRSRVSGFLNLAGGQALSRADFARRMLAFWGVPVPDPVEVVPAPPGVPTDLRLCLERAAALVAVPAGVDAVLARAG